MTDKIEPCPTIDTGDAILHKPTGETWLVAYCENGHVCCCGWPESLAKVEDCELKRKATLKERAKLLNDMAASSGSRQAYAARTLAAETAPHVPPLTPCPTCRAPGCTTTHCESAEGPPQTSPLGAYVPQADLTAARQRIAALEAELAAARATGLAWKAVIERIELAKCAARVNGRACEIKAYAAIARVPLCDRHFRIQLTDCVELNRRINEAAVNLPDPAAVAAAVATKESK